MDENVSKYYLNKSQLILILKLFYLAILLVILCVIILVGSLILIKACCSQKPNEDHLRATARHNPTAIYFLGSTQTNAQTPVSEGVRTEFAREIVNDVPPTYEEAIKLPSPTC
jgi:hypothetical protein